MRLRCSEKSTSAFMGKYGGANRALTGSLTTDRHDGVCSKAVLSHWAPLTEDIGRVLSPKELGSSPEKQEHF